MKKLFYVLLACNALVTAANAYNVSFDLEADKLKTSSGAAMPTTGICLLVASTTNATFGTINAGASLSVGSFLDGGDDQILFKMDLRTNGTAGSLGENFAINTANFSNLDGNDPLILYWFPTLTVNTTQVPNTATSYGQFRTTTTQDNGQSWVMPAATTNNYRLYLLTSDASIFGPGTHAPADANAMFTTSAVPEPSTTMLLGGLMLGGAGAYLRRRRLKC